MGWIHDRHMKSGGSLNKNPKNNGSQKGPLRKVIAQLETGNGLFSRNFYKLECGHEAYGTAGAARVRCRKCKLEALKGTDS